MYFIIKNSTETGRKLILRIQHSVITLKNNAMSPILDSTYGNFIDSGDVFFYSVVSPCVRATCRRVCACAVCACGGMSACCTVCVCVRALAGGCDGAVGSPMHQRLCVNSSPLIILRHSNMSPPSPPLLLLLLSLPYASTPSPTRTKNYWGTAPRRMLIHTT